MAVREPLQSTALAPIHASRPHASKKLKGAFFYVVVTVIAFVWIVPVIFIIFTALKSQHDLNTGGLFTFPHRIQWSNFTQAWTIGEMSTYMRNSIIICLIKVPAGILVESLAAFALSRLQFRGRQGIFIFLLMGMSIPMQVTLIPLSLMLTKLHLINTYFALIIMYIAFGLPFGVLVLRGFFRQIPRELDESAKIDGCSVFGVYWRIIMPLAMPAIATLVILDFLATWNEFLLAETFLTSDNLRTVPAGLLNFATQYTSNQTLESAGVLLSIVPVVIVYLMFQKYFVSGLGGAVKG